MSTSKKIARNLHLPIQSGSNAVLNAMNRKYTKEYYLSIVEKARELMPDIGITTDLLVGFPLESEQDYQETVELVKQVRFTNAFTFVYSRRKGTPADLMPQLASDVKKERITNLVRLVNKISYELSLDYINKNYSVLLEDVQAKYDGFLCGRTECNRLVNVECDSSYIGKIVNVKINKVKGSSLFGELVI